MRERRVVKEVQMTGGNTVPVAKARMPLMENKTNSPVGNTMQQQVYMQEGQDLGEQNMSEQIEPELQRSSPVGQLGSQVRIAGRRPSVSQEQWTPAGKRKSRGSKGSPGSPASKGKKSREEEWVWDMLSSK